MYAKRETVCVIERMCEPYLKSNSTFKQSVAIVKLSLNKNA